MNDYKITLLIIKNRIKLEKLIDQNADYSKILEQSRKLDVYIAKKMAIQLNKNKTSNN